MSIQGRERPVTGREEFRRGWPVIAGAMICYALSIAAIPIYTNGVFITELAEAFGKTRGDISLTWIAHTVVLAPMAPVIGLIADRVGIRLPIAVGLVGMAVVYLLMGTVMHSIGGFIALQMLAAFVGAGTLPVIFTRAVNSWFDKARGLALGFTLLGTGITATFAPALLASVIVTHGWQGAYLAIAVTLAIVAPLIIWLVRLAPWDHAVGEAPPSPTTGLTLGEAARTRVFWIMAVAFFFQATLVFGFLQHFVPMLTDVGMDKVSAAKIVGIAGIAILIGRFGSGAILDHVFARWIAVGCCLICAAGTLALGTLGVSAAPIGVFCLGLVMGAEVDLIGFLASRYFGLLAYGRIYGLLYGAFLVGAGLGPSWVGALYNRYGSYQPALLIAAAAMVILAGVFMTLPRYGKPGQPISTQRSA